MNLRPLLGVFAVSVAFLSNTFAFDPEARPIGWDDLSSAEQTAFLDMQAPFVAQQEALDLSDQEYAELSKVEKGNHNQSVKSLEVAYQGALDDAGYVLEKRAVQLVAESATPRRKTPRMSPGTITYDTGTPVSGSTASSLCVGNHFTTALGDPIASSGTVTKFTFYLFSASGNAFLSMYDQLAGTTAQNVTSASFGPFTTGFNTQTVNLNYTGGTFLAGVWNFGSDVVALDTGTVGGQGFHGMQINDNFATATGFTTLPSSNTIFRATGPNIIPVELMKFEVENEAPSDSQSQAE